MVLSKSWRDGADQTPQHHVDLALVDYWSPRIREALASSLTDAEIRTAIHAAHAAKVAGADPAEAARATLAPLLSTDKLAAVLRAAITDAYSIGGVAAGRQIATPTEVKKAAGGDPVLPTPSINVDWGNWQAGDLQAATMEADGGLAGLLDEADISIKGIAGSALDTLGNQIGDGLVHGAPVDQVAEDITNGGWVTADRAERIAHTETARAVSAATLDTYRLNGIGSWNLVLSDGACDLCVEVANDGPYPNEDMESAPPVHPYCRCSASPVTGDETMFGDELLQGAGIGDENPVDSTATDEAAPTEGKSDWELIQGIAALGGAVGAILSTDEDKAELLQANLAGDYTVIGEQKLPGDKKLGEQFGRLAAAETVEGFVPDGPEAGTGAALAGKLAGAAADKDRDGAMHDAQTSQEAVASALLDDLDNREEDDAVTAGFDAGLQYFQNGGKGPRPPNPFPNNQIDLQQLWEQAFVVGASGQNLTGDNADTAIEAEDITKTKE